MLQSRSELSYPPSLLACKPLDDEALIVSEDFQPLFRQWNHWQKGETLPEWSRFDPLDYPKLLPHVLLVEFHPDNVEDIRIVLMGEHVKGFLGHFPKGTPFREAMPQETFEDVVAANRYCAENACAAYFVKSLGWKARDLLVYELLKLPFSKPDGKIGVVCLLRFGLEKSQIQAVMAAD